MKVPGNILIFLSFFHFIAAAQTDSTTPHQKHFIHTVGAGLQHGFIFAHSDAVQNTKGANPTGIEVSFAGQRNDAQVWDLCNCFPRKGLVLSFYDYDNRVLGKSFTAAYFLEPSYRINNRMFFSFKAAGGLSYLTNPFDSVNNPTNMSYSTAVSGYLLLGAGIWIRLHQKWWINPTVNYQHISNGGMKQPNKGINYPTAGVTITYQRNPSVYYVGPRRKDKFWRDEPVRYDVFVFGNARRSVERNGNSRRVALLGAGMQAAKIVGRINNITAAAEVYRDEVIARSLAADSLDVSPLKAGLSVGHEFLLGKFIFSQRLGTYIFDQTPYDDELFHRWGLVYNVNNSWHFGFNLLAHRHVAAFIDLRLIYSWSGQR